MKNRRFESESSPLFSPAVCWGVARIKNVIELSILRQEVTAEALKKMD
jgi:hypothetical protein